MIKLASCLMLILAFACKSAAPAKEQQSFEKWVQENLGKNIITQKNTLQNFALCVKESDDLQSVSYYVVRLSDLNVVLKDNISRASLAWIDEYKIEIKFTPGTVQKDTNELPVKIIDVSKFLIEKP